VASQQTSFAEREAYREETRKPTKSTGRLLVAMDVNAFNWYPFSKSCGDETSIVEMIAWVQYIRLARFTPYVADDRTCLICVSCFLSLASRNAATATTYDPFRHDTRKAVHRLRHRHLSSATSV
jgi:hypothetical protein